MGDTAKSPHNDGGHSSFLQRLIAILFGTDEPDREKRRQLKRIAAELSRHKYRFFKPRSGEILAGLGRFFWEIYRVVGPAQNLLPGAESSNALKTILIERHHTEEQQQLRAALSEPGIREAAGRVPPKQLAATVTHDLESYLAAFDSETVTSINRTFDAIRQLVDLIRFDYFVLLRKFDSTFVEGNFLHPPRLEAISGEHLSDDIKDFLEVLLPIEFDADWDRALDVLTEYKGVEVADRGAWKKLLTALRSVARSGVLQMIVQLIDDDPGYKPLARRERHHIVESHLSVLKTQTEAILQKVLRETRDNRVRELASTIFGSEPVVRTRNYTESANSVFAKRLLAGFTRTEAMNYLIAFLTDHFNAEARGLVSELLIVRGRWCDSSISSEFSEALYAVLNAAEQLVEFDDSLSDDGELGARLRRASAPVKENSPQSTRLLRQALQDVNERATELITDAASDLITIGKVIKVLIDDLEQNAQKVLLNWKELEAYSERPVRDRLVALYKKIYAFLQLLKLLVKK